MNKYTWANLLVLAPLSLVLTGCVTMARFEELEQRVVHLESENASLKEVTGMHETRLENLNTILKRSEADLRQGYAATTSTVEELEDRLRRALGSQESSQYQQDRNTNLLNRLGEFLDSKFGTTLLALPDNLPDQPEPLYLMAAERMKTGNLKEARAVFREYLRRYPDGTQAADAQFAVGETFRTEKDWERAKDEYKVVWSAYRESKIAPRALLGIADVLAASNNCAKAKQVYDLLIREEPKSEAAGEAKTLRKTVKQRCN